VGECMSMVWRGMSLQTGGREIGMTRWERGGGSVCIHEHGGKGRNSRSLPARDSSGARAGLSARVTCSCLVPSQLRKRAELEQKQANWPQVKQAAITPPQIDASKRKVSFSKTLLSLPSAANQQPPSVHRTSIDSIDSILESAHPPPRYKYVAHSISSPFSSLSFSIFFSL